MKTDFIEKTFEKRDGKIISFGGSISFVFNDLEDGYYTMELYSLDTRTDRQNNLLWGTVYKQVSELFLNMGVSATDINVHEYYKRQFLRKRKKCKITKKVYVVDGSTRKLSKKAFSKYIESINKDCIDKFGIGLDLSSHLTTITENNYDILYPLEVRGSNQ